jgi:hypothetical protein
MNLLDENIPLDQRDLLRAWGIPCRVVGLGIVARAHHDGLQFWQRNRAARQRTTWPVNG